MSAGSNHDRGSHEGDPFELEFTPVNDRFELEDAEQRGDVTVIRRARDRQSGKVVGIERPLPALQDDSESIAVFPAMLSSRGELRHPHILELYDVARDDESAYGVVEWAAGGTLADRLIRRGPLGEGELLKVANSVGSALEHASQRRRNHGGIVPENLCLTADGSVKVAGFGLDKLREITRSAERIGSRSGTQMSGATDILDLCRTLYRLATGAERLDRDRIARLPEWLRALLTRGLIDDANQRFGDAREFLESLERFRQLGDLEFGRLPLDDKSIAIEPERSHSDSGSSGQRGSGSGGSKGSSGSGGSKGSGGSRGSGGRGAKGTPEEFPWRPLDDDYEIEGDPRQGGMGAVYRAHEIATGRQVAIKRMKPTVQLDADSWRRFHREAANIAKLNHPHVLQLLQVGRDDQGDYLVLEWASGGSLLEKVQREGALPLPEVVRLAHKIGSALVYAHGKGVVHRDIKPHNILISDSGEPKVADFGLARSFGDETLTSSGGGAGSLHYLAPEQGVDARTADGRADLYSLAATLYHVATGKKPIAIDPAQLPAPLRKPLLKSLSEKPDDRYPSVEAFLIALDASMQSASRGPWRWVAGVAAALVVAGVGYLQFTGREKSPTSDDIAKAPIVATEPAQKPEPPRVESAKQEPPKVDPEAERISPEKPTVAEPPKQSPTSSPKSEPSEVPIAPKDVAEPPAKPPAPPADLGVIEDDLAKARAFEDAWQSATAGDAATARALRENDDVRAGRTALAAAMQALTDGRYDDARSGAKEAGTRLGRGFRSATVEYLLAEIPKRLNAKDTAELEGASRLLDELRNFSAEYVDPRDVTQLGERIHAARAKLAAATEATPTDDRPSETPTTTEATPPSEKPTEPEPTAKTPPEATPVKPAPPQLDPNDPWSVAIETIATSKRYGNRRIVKQSGLAPLRVDPKSGLYEFLVEGSGAPPAIGADGAYVLTPETGIVLVLLPGGAFRYGASKTAGNANAPFQNVDPRMESNEIGEREVRLDPFFLSKYELTSAQYARIGNVSLSDAGVLPISRVTRTIAETIVKKLALALPTEAQWEYAYRAGTHTPYYFGDSEDALPQHGNARPKRPTRENQSVLVEIARYTPNGFGLHDMAGNVSEWCADAWTSDLYNLSVRDGDGLADSRTATTFGVLRGGCYADEPRRTRATARVSCGIGQLTSGSVMGFRPARGLTTK